MRLGLRDKFAEGGKFPTYITNPNWGSPWKVPDDDFETETYEEKRKKMIDSVRPHDEQFGIATVADLVFYLQKVAQTPWELHQPVSPPDDEPTWDQKDKHTLPGRPKPVQKMKDPVESLNPLSLEYWA